MTKSVIKTVGAALLALALTACGPVSPPNAAAVSEPSANAPPAPAAADALTLSGAWIGAMPAGSKVAAGYVTIANAADVADTLVGVSSPRAPRTEMHEMSMDGEIMRMREVTALEVPARGALVLAPGGLHLMFIGVEAPFAAGESVPVTLTFARAGVRDVVMTVRARDAAGHGGGHGGH